MTEETPVQETPVPTISPRHQYACDVAMSRISTAGDDSPDAKIVGAKKDLNSKGNGPHWYRMVYRSGSWQYVSDERLPNGSFLASDRRCEVRGDVYVGEVVVSHDRGKKVDLAWLILSPDSEGKVMLPIDFSSRRDGNLVFHLPDGSKLDLANPRK